MGGPPCVGGAGGPLDRWCDWCLRLAERAKREAAKRAEEEAVRAKAKEEEARPSVLRAFCFRHAWTHMSPGPRLLGLSPMQDSSALASCMRPRTRPEYRPPPPPWTLGCLAGLLRRPPFAADGRWYSKPS